MSTKISGISALLAGDGANALQGTVKADKPSTDFSSYMNLNSYGKNSSQQIYQVKNAMTGADGKTVDSCAYDKYQYNGKNVVKNVDNTKVFSKDDIQKVSDKLQSFAEDVKSVLKDELSVTDEEIEAAMSMLQLNLSDLTDVRNLASLVTQLTGGNDPVSILMNNNFQNILGSVEDLTKELLGELGITKEDLISLCDQMLSQDTQTSATGQATAETQPAVNDAQTKTEDLGKDLTTDQDISQEAVDSSKENVVTQPVADAVRSDQNKDQTMKADDVVVPNSTEETSAEETLPVDSASMANEQSEEQTGADKEEALPQNAQNTTKVKTESTGHGIAFEQHVQNPVGTQDIPNTSSLPQTAPYVDVNNIMDQIQEYTKVMISQDTTTLEMQLNPENLGKIYLHVTEKAGAITAQITATNDTVKEALQAQIVELKENLNQQGIKIEAVEVTVASHEFEQNLEQNANREEQHLEQTEDQKKNGNRRNINLNDLDGLSGVMTEEESLVAKIMQDNGNQMDISV